MYLDTLSSHKVSSHFLIPLTLREILENRKRVMGHYPQLALLNYPNQDIWCYYGLF